MHVDDRVRKSVVFIGATNQRGFSPYGTAMLGLAVFEDMGNIALVTAKHVVDSIPGDEIHVRVNMKAGGAEVYKVAKNLAITFNDKALDLAIFPITLDPITHDIFVINLSTANWEERVAEHGEPSTGDEVCVVGLYTTHYGHIQNIPIVRIGHIAAVPQEKVMTDVGYVHGWLIECHSIAGLSGSPVFYNVPLMRVKGEALQYVKRPVYIPLGILIGYHVIESVEDEIAVPQYQQNPDDREYKKPPSTVDERRTGFGVVIPIQRVFQVFESEAMKKIISQGVAEAREKSGFRRASARPVSEFDPPAIDANPTHREDFTRLLGAAARKPPQED